MASQQPIIQGALVDASGRYELCWITHTEAGEATITKRNVVVAQHGPWFYLQFADEDFQPYPCGHAGLRCDLLDPSSAWLLPVAIELDGDVVLQTGDILVSRTSARYWSMVSSNWIGQTAQSYLDSFCVLSGAWRVLRPAYHMNETANEPSSAMKGVADGGPGLQAAG